MHSFISSEPGKLNQFDKIQAGKQLCKQASFHASKQAGNICFLRQVRYMAAYVGLWQVGR